VIAPLARPPALRLLRSRRALWLAAAWCALAVGVALTARSAGWAHRTDHVLLGAYGPLIVPLLAYVIAGGVIGARSLSSAVGPLAAFGAPPARAAAAAIAVAIAVCAVAAAAVAAVVVLLAHGAGDPPLARDLLSTTYAGAMGAGAYGAWFVAGASFGRRGGGRAALLVVDWLAGGSDGLAALVTPRGHLRNLLGGAPPMGLPERASAVALVLLGAAYALLAVRRAR